MCVFRFNEDTLKLYHDLLLYREKKAALKGEGRGPRELQEHFAFILVKDPSVMTKIAQEGVKTKSIAFNALGKCHTSISNGIICGTFIIDDISIFLSSLVSICVFVSDFLVSNHLGRRKIHTLRLF